ncbi:MAG: transglutaminase-like cysteine peptidase [Rhodocyclaceae bacterium]|nr:transglutaminase-like cysteine peptidase [Rhodocyclaceae bacterium]MCB1893568.1 transglutaminase-like cysteine peptidase [Rhodocyclaceae bacterium]
MISQTGADRLLWPLAAMRRLAALAAVFLLFQATIADVEKMLATLQRYGGAESVFRDWRQLIDDSKSLEARDKLKRINEFFNRKLLFLDDIKVWGQTDYWATPLETLAKGQGDCEDFTIAKYFTLLSAGMPNEQLRLIYVKARIGGPASNVTQAHMVLAWYETPDAEPLLLDNLITDIRPASRRPDLQPVFSFNSMGIWANPIAKGVPSSTGVGRLTRWQDLLNRAKAEGFAF